MILLVSINVSSDSSNCFDEYCFTYPEADVTLSFGDARTWCANNNSSTLAVVSSKSAQDALAQFLSSSKMSSPLYINAKLDQRTESTWFSIGGSNFSGLYNLYNVMHNLQIKQIPLIRF